MRPRPTGPPLRFADAAPARLPSAAVAAANRAAAGPRPDDPRWVLAVRTAQLLEGGRAAILTAPARHSLETLAARMGLRPFDAALVISIVQDAARTGRSPGRFLPLPPEVASRVALIAPPDAEPSRAALARFLASVALACALFAAVSHWLG